MTFFWWFAFQQRSVCKNDLSKIKPDYSRRVCIKPDASTWGSGYVSIGWGRRDFHRFLVIGPGGRLNLRREGIDVTTVICWEMTWQLCLCNLWLVWNSQDGLCSFKDPETMSIVGWDPVIDEVPSACEGHETKAACKSQVLCADFAWVIVVPLHVTDSDSITGVFSFSDLLGHCGQTEAIRLKLWAAEAIFSMLWGKLGASYQCLCLSQQA